MPVQEKQCNKIYKEHKLEIKLVIQNQEIGINEFDRARRGIQAQQYKLSQNHPTENDQPHETNVLGPNGFVDLSVKDFLFELALKDDQTEFDRMAKTFDVNPRRLFWIKIQAAIRGNKPQRIQTLTQDVKKIPGLLIY
ncbi:MAG: hypothetical protein EZS28_049858 [Streblomastix strix]|uniref:Vps16 C-terminal domain-containing protein n=1 Tax=Streblomastix strix TaxID=222440 RepID=A0A5J4TB01_9EUKA|nr:MAG: hypothetical protein EZS28_049858 [Streblomastix strix]